MAEQTADDARRGDVPAGAVDGSFVEVEVAAPVPAEAAPAAAMPAVPPEERRARGQTRTALAVVQPAPLLPDAHEWRTMMGMAEALYHSGLLPGHVRSPQAALAVIQKGRELQVPPMYALTNIVVIQGKPTANAELMLALIYRDHGDDAIRIEATTPDCCTIAYRRRSWTEAQQYTFTIEDAHRAGLASGANPAWLKYPQAMLRARAISAVARMAFPDSIAGMYTPEDLGARVHLAEDGEMVYSVPDEAPRSRRPARQGAAAHPHAVPRSEPAPADAGPGEPADGPAAEGGADPAAGTDGEAVGGMQIDFVTPRTDPLQCMAVLADGSRCRATLRPLADRATGRATPPDELLRRMRAKGVPAGAVLCLKHAADYVRALHTGRADATPA